MSSSETANPDKELTAAVKTGDSEAFQQLYFRYAEPLFGFLWRRLSQRELAEDLVQELFAKVWRNRANLDPNQSIKAYLYQAANNLMIDHLRRKNPDLGAVEVMPEHSTVEVDETRFEKRDQIQKALADLPDAQRNVFLLSRFEGLKYGEIAAVMNISVKTVETHMNRALKKLRHQLRALLALLFWG
ncbi:RNA polymerase sigma-70 factor [Acanthopleuribacter pedis]|uniref:RNA polymerase sigma-70 factor n=1 Tax=Acanthopleuribacter pedis TaxID=442870 RepID=A0A8J7QET7_9BACT|nr:RNA polymerase sigma-70 factor [Acanthopleuribacter pedis]